MKHLLAIKKGMTQVYEGDKIVPVTILEVPQNTVVLCKKDDKGFLLRLGIGVKKKPTKAEGVMYKPAGVTPLKTWDVRDEEIKAGEKFGVSTVATGDVLNICAVTKGKGFAGVVKRWHFKGGPKTHGQSDRERAPGSISAGTTIGRILKGTRMAGRMGGVNRTVKGRRVVDVTEDFLLVKGPPPGSIGGILKITVEKGKKDEK